MKLVVAVGTIQYPFERMTQVVRLIHQQYPQILLFVQSGHTHSLMELEGIEGACFVEQAILRQQMREADIVLIHGGEGSILDGLECSQSLPIVFPREFRFGEHIDTYQSEVAEAVVKRGLCVSGKTTEEIVALISERIKEQKSKDSFRNLFLQGNIHNRKLIKQLKLITDSL